MPRIEITIWLGEMDPRGAEEIATLIEQSLTANLPAFRTEVTVRGDDSEGV